MLALLFGALLAGATFLLLSRSLPRMLLGVFLLGNAANIALYAGGRVLGLGPPLVARGETALAAGAGNPLPQALILTAIVISFGLFAFALVMAWAAHRAYGTADAEELREAEPPGLPATDAARAAAAEPAPDAPPAKPRMAA